MSNLTALKLSDREAGSGSGFELLISWKLTELAVFFWQNFHYFTNWMNFWVQKIQIECQSK